jgi:hypothetical protein
VADAAAQPGDLAGGAAVTAPCLLAALLVSSGPPAPELLALRSESVDSRPALTLVLSAPPSEVQVRRDGDGIVLSLAARVVRVVPMPAAPVSVQSLALERAGDRVRLKVRVPPDVTYAVSRNGTSLSLVLTAPPARTASAQTDTLELYRRLRPVASAPAVPEPGPAVAAATDQRREGLTVGRLALRPTVDLIYLDGEVTLLETPDPVHDRYWDLRPRVAFDLPLSRGTLDGSYEAHFRRSSSFGVVQTATHLVDVALEAPVGPRLVLRAADHFARGALETLEVDPGREYFFRLGRFTRNNVSLGGRMELGRGHVEATAALRTVRLDEGAGFFDNDERSVGAGLRYELTPTLRWTSAYTYDHVPPPSARPLVEMRAHTVAMGLQGELTPLVTGEVSVGLRDQRAPRAGAGGTRFRGVTARGRVVKEFAPGATFTLSGQRSTFLSAFEQNAFYVANTIGAETSLPLPWSLAFHGSGFLHRNDYRTAASELGLPREDHIRGWSAGLGRPFTRWAYVRSDYRWERRDSNLDRLDTDTHVFSVQLGVGFFGVER